MKAEFPAREGVITVESLSGGKWGKPHFTVTYTPVGFDEPDGGLPPLTDEEVQQLRRTLEFVVQEEGRSRQ